MYINLIDIDTIAVMASKEVPSFEDLTPVSPKTASGEEKQIKLDPGEDVVLKLRFAEQNAGRYGNTKLHVDDMDGETAIMWSNKTVDREMKAGEIGPGDIFGVKKAEESEEYEQNGETKQSWDFEVRKFPEDN